MFLTKTLGYFLFNLSLSIIIISGFDIHYTEAYKVFGVVVVVTMAMYVSTGSDIVELIDPPYWVKNDRFYNYPPENEMRKNMLWNVTLITLFVVAIIELYQFLF